ncbi:MAG: sigma-54-dependent Fis family transcriptional regulator [Candidatus Competibacteraceae bacterium]|nr:sigma-54-dependent Fis family transcriptional regulator [Candidatus Competibacteraceae bacterium]MBK7982228.1 sigma-54-dependent Fis family transcriptional regulator [Candidatus Competibacteraceae bacterium]MBK8899221.1 sigma-54-dependent Fis family transcriptional regulator [Candidatus Competibacteraceae bacterium]MBK8963260.1 sigma-54-dependent Fis family transcriptional regulator [Candidatus Competibacteraceae bacterium]MBK9952221.1 sigma-54-dependent Fis family transcriptional regulator 
MKRYKLLVVDDEKDILRTLTLTFEEDYEVFTARSGMEALSVLERQEIALIMADQRMPEMTGVELLQRSIRIRPHAIRIILTGYTDTVALIQAINKGHIYQYVTKPWDRQELRITVKRALDSYELCMENERLLAELQAANEQLRDENTFIKKELHKDLKFSEIIGHSSAMRRVFDLVHKVIDTPVTVLLTGETGTGKTLLARYIHYNGPRKDKLFVEQNCGALPEALLESELFGHKKGAFTGAVYDQKGLFEAADGGTVFLDEISEMSALLQVKLLQVLQEGRFRRVGDNSYRQVDVRIISATNKDLDTEIKNNRFRSDLYYRINVFPIHIPPLRERLEDIPLLADFCLKKYRRKMHSSVGSFSEEVLHELSRYNFPGNVRELENLIERAVLLSSDGQVEIGDWLPQPCYNPGVSSRMEKMERSEIIRLLEIHHGKHHLVARDMGMSRTTLWRRLKYYGIQITEEASISGRTAP